MRISLASAHARAGDHERAVRLAAQARAAFEARGEHWGVAASVLVEAIGAVGAGDVPRTETFAAIAARHADAIAYEAFQVPVRASRVFSGIVLTVNGAASALT